jgi:subtilisin family serine protease
MVRVSVLIEVETTRDDAFAAFEAAAVSPGEAARQSEQALRAMAGLDIELEPGFVPVPLFPEEKVHRDAAEEGFAAFASPTTNPDTPASSLVVAAEVDSTRLDDLRARSGVRVFSNSRQVLLGSQAGSFAPLPSAAGIDCRPFRPAVSAWTIRSLLGVRAVWQDGFRGQNVAVGILDEGINGQVYPVVGGFSLPGAQPPGTAPITSHGSMCAADVLVAAPAARLYDYPFLGIPRSGGALRMFQAVLDQRRRDGTPHLTSNSYGFVSVPPLASAPGHEIHDLNHPLHRKIREVIASGAPAFFAAGNCGLPCPSGKCLPSGIGPGNSIHASNSLTEVITMAAVNANHERIGYSSTGPGGFDPRKPDLASYSHFFGNFGPGRPGGTDDSPFDNGTSAATPVAAGVAALLMSAFPGLTPARLKQALVAGAIDVAGAGWDTVTGHGVINAAASYYHLYRSR